MRRVDVASALVYDDQDNLLLVKNKNGDSFYWGPPGGAVEEGETLEQAVIREVQEETGYSIAITGLNSVREMFFRKSEHHALIVTFYARVISGDLEIADPDQEILEAIWANADTARTLMPSLFEQLKLSSEDNKTMAFYAFEGLK